MKDFKIFAVFNQTSFTRHNATGDVKGEITVTTDRCDIEPILASLNVQSYQIIGCKDHGIDVKCQLMSEMKEIPKHYFEKRGTPTKTNNFKLTYFYDGCKFYDVVNATSEETAFSYLCWICNDDLHFVKAEICNDLPSYWCPVDWVRPDPAYVDPEVAKYRSLMKSLEVAGITQHDYYTPELDKVMRSLGYTVSDIILETDDVFDVFNGKYIEYTRQNHYTLRVEIKEES